jgi:hypothetical protein
MLSRRAQLPRRVAEPQQDSSTASVVERRAARVFFCPPALAAPTRRRATRARTRGRRPRRAALANRR